MGTRIKTLIPGGRLQMQAAMPTRVLPDPVTASTTVPGIECQAFSASCCHRCRCVVGESGRGRGSSRPGVPSSPRGSGQSIHPVFGLFKLVKADYVVGETLSLRPPAPRRATEGNGGLGFARAPAKRPQVPPPECSTPDRARYSVATVGVARTRADSAAAQSCAPPRKRRRERAASRSTNAACACLLSGGADDRERGAGLSANGRRGSPDPEPHQGHHGASIWTLVTRPSE